MTVGICVEHHEIAVLARADLHLGTVAREEAPVVADPDLDCGIIPTD